jgi:hypothetical protein
MPQDTFGGSNRRQEAAAARGHIARVRIINAPLPQALSFGRTTMQERNRSVAHRSLRWAIAPAIALSALVAGLPAAQADQQATTAEMDNAINWRAASGAGFSGAYAQAPLHHDRTYAHAVRSRR